MLRHPILRVILSALLLLLSACDADPAATVDKSASPMLIPVSGEPLSWSELRGEWVLINYWAEWCKPCLEEIPELNRVDAREGLRVLAVNYDGIEGQALLDLGRRMGIEYLQLGRDPAPGLGWQVPDALPATFLVRPSGELADVLMGAQTEADLLARIGRD